MTWLPRIVGMWDRWCDFGLPSLLSFSEKQGCHVCLRRLYPAQESSADGATGDCNTVQAPLAKHWARTHALGSGGGLDFSSGPPNLLQPTLV